MSQLIFIAAMAFAAMLGATGQLALKKVSDVPLGLMLFSWYTWLFIATYGVAVIINLLAYRAGGQASYLYPIIATSYIWVVILAAIFLGEPLTAGKIVGSIVIVIGVAIIAVW